MGIISRHKWRGRLQHLNPSSTQVKNPERKTGAAAFLFCSPAARYPPDPPGTAAPAARPLAATARGRGPTPALPNLSLPLRTPPHLLLRCATWRSRKPPCSTPTPPNPIVKRGTNQSQTTPQSYGQRLVISLSLADLTANRDHNLLWKSHSGETPKTLAIKKLWVSPATSSFLGKEQSRRLRSPAKVHKPPTAPNKITQANLRAQRTNLNAQRRDTGTRSANCWVIWNLSCLLVASR